MSIRNTTYRLLYEILCCKLSFGICTRSYIFFVVEAPVRPVLLVATNLGLIQNFTAVIVFVELGVVR